MSSKQMFLSRVQRACFALVLVAFIWFSRRHGEASGGFQVFNFDFMLHSLGIFFAAVMLAQIALGIALLKTRPTLAASLLLTTHVSGMLYAFSAVQLGPHQLPDRGPHVLAVIGVGLMIAVFAALRVPFGYRRSLSDRRTSRG